MIAERDHAPLSSACVRALHDKIYDKKKTAVVEIEKMVKEFHSVNNTVQIKRLIKVLSEFATSQNQNARSGGLIALAGVAVALGKETITYTDELIRPILSCFCDPDLRVRYYACESLYNLVKTIRDAVLPYFTDIFNVLSKLATDSDQSVKNASELLDRLMKDIVIESSSFDLIGFIPLLRERIYTKNSFARQFIISWVSVLDAVPDIDLIIFLPEILDGMFKILEDSMIDIKKQCDTALGEFLRSIKNDPSRVDFAAMINILITHAQASDELLQFTAITWIKEFVQLSGPLMLPYMSGIFTAVLPCLAYDGDSRRIQDIKETAATVNFSLMKLITIDKDNQNIDLQSSDLNTSDTAVTTNVKSNKKLDLPSVVDILTQHLAHNSVQTKVAVLRWIHHLYTNIPNKMFDHIDEIFPALLRTLSDLDDEVVQQCLVVLAEVISSPAGKFDTQDKYSTSQAEGENSISTTLNPYYAKFFENLLKLFSTEKNLLDDRGSFIIRQLCILLNAEDIYRTLAETLLSEPNLKFASIMVETLNMILLTSSELFELRNKLKDLNSEESCSLFCCLYETWCYNPVATVALCLLTQNYSHACCLIRIFGNLEVTVEFLIEIDKLVQLIESPIFADLRLELLEVPCDQNLIRALYGLLMLLPQSEAFHTLRSRLACIPSLHSYCDNRNISNKKESPVKMKSIDFEKLLEHFIKIQDKHKLHKQSIRSKQVSNMARDKNSIEF